jgi:hypothetical protein
VFSLFIRESFGWPSISAKVRHVHCGAIHY